MLAFSVVTLDNFQSVCILLADLLLDQILLCSLATLNLL